MKSTIHIAAIDSLRFFAAMIVVLSHCSSVFGYSFINTVFPKGLLNDKSAVSFFFVLSGFVLYLSTKDFFLTFQSYVAFTIRRVFRLYPLFYISLLLSLAVIHFLPLTDIPSLMATEYIQLTLEKDHRDLYQTLMQFTLILPMVDNTFLNPPMWTLTAEMRVALVFPIIALVIHLLRPGMATLGLFLFGAMATWVAKVTIPTVYIIPLFYLGALLAKFMVEKKAKGKWAGFIFLLSLLIYMSPVWIGRHTVGAVGHFYLAGLGSAGLIYGVIFSRFLSKRLSVKPLATLGSYSYGIYIIHFPVLLAVAYWTQNLKLSAFSSFAIVLVVTLALSAFFYHFVEIRCIRLGRQLAAFVNQPKPQAVGKTVDPVG